MDEPADLIETVYRHTVELARTTEGPIARLKVAAGEVSMEIEWPVGEQEPVLIRSAPNGHAKPAAEPEPPDERTSIVAPMVGTFYRAAEPGAEPFVKEGDLVQVGQQVGILEAMKLMNPIQAATAGRVADVLVQDGAAVEFGQALIALTEA